MVNYQLSCLPIGGASYTESADHYVRFVSERQLKDVSLWEHFVEVFHTRPDFEDKGWRGEYFGKMMRGACLIYRYNKDESLYEILENAVTALLQTQDEYGRITTYPPEADFMGWDMWTRKYVMTSLLHFREICKDEGLRQRILDALCRHADDIVRKVGDKEGQIRITRTSHWWGGVNSTSILEPFVHLYRETGEKRYFDFATYIIGTGGCEESDIPYLQGGCRGGSLIEAALENKVMPFEYPEVKAYETMSFFEGVLAYYEVTGEEKYLRAVKNFVESVASTDITLIGSSGCTHELFDNSSVKQTEYSDVVMQETCVTVTWMRLLSRLLLLTGDVRYADRIEHSAYNAMYGSVNEHMLTSVESQRPQPIPLPFDSYSPIYNNARGRGIGGFKLFADGTYYGCCACIAAAGIAILPLDAVVTHEGEFVINHYLSGEVTVGETTLVVNSEYPRSGHARIDVKGKPAAITLRIPAFVKNATVSYRGKTVSAPCGYFKLPEALEDGESLTLDFEIPINRIDLNGRSAFTYGVLTLARDALKEGGRDLSVPLTPLYDEGGMVILPADARDGEEVRFLLKTKEGDIPLTDYASCGKRWKEPSCRISVFLNLA